MTGKKRERDATKEIHTREVAAHVLHADTLAAVHLGIARLHLNLHPCADELVRKESRILIC